MMMPRINAFAKKVQGFITSDMFFKLSVSWFVIQASLFAVFTRFGVPPDESWHVGLIRLFQRDGVDPFIQNQEGYYFLGDVTNNVSWLYHYLMSFPAYVLDLFGSDRLTITGIRLISVLLGVATILLVRKIGQELKVSNFAINVSTFLLANTAMFIVVFASVTYDALSVMLTISFVYQLLMMYRERTAKNLIVLGILTLLGLFTKYTFAPIALVGWLFILSVLLAHPKAAFQKLVKSTKMPDKYFGWLVAISVLLLSLFGATYVKNYISYGSVSPACDKVHTTELCMQNEVFARNKKFKAEPLPGPRFPFDVFGLLWGKAMVERTYGIFAQKAYIPPQKLLLVLYAALTLYVVACIRMYKRSNTGINLLIAISLFYILVLLITNWTSYHRQGRFGVALQGRYALPILPLLYVTGSHYLDRLTKSSLVKTATFSLIMLLFFLLCLPTYIINTKTMWRYPIGVVSSARSSSAILLPLQNM